MGNLYDRVKIDSDKGIYYDKLEESDNACKFSFVFSDSTLTINTVGNGYDCGFGGNVSADGQYKKETNAKYDHFVDMTGKTYFFAKTKPEDYAKILK